MQMRNNFLVTALISSSLDAYFIIIKWKAFRKKVILEQKSFWDLKTKESQKNTFLSLDLCCPPYFPWKQSKEDDQPQMRFIRQRWSDQIEFLIVKKTYTPF